MMGLRPKLSLSDPWIGAANNWNKKNIVPKAPNISATRAGSPSLNYVTSFGSTGAAMKAAMLSKRIVT